MAVAARTLRYLVIGAATLAVLLVAVLFVLTRTDFGVEQAGRFALDRLRASVDGTVEVERITSRGILRGVTLHGVSIVDAEGRPFLVADSARLAYHLRTLLGGDLSFDRLTLHRPEIYLELLPGRDEWNYERLVARDTLPTDTTARDDLILIDDATIHDGLVVIRMPWEPDGPVTPADTARLILEDVPGGTARTIRFEQVNARIPRIAWQTPDEEGSLIRIASLSAHAYIWDTPADIRALEGTIAIRDSLFTFEAPRVRLPDSDLSMTGRFILDDAGNRYDVELGGDDLAFRDFRWLYPQLPAGGGALRLRIQTQEDGGLLWLARDARLRADGTELAGSFGVVTGDSLYFTNVSLRASPLDLDLLRALLPVDLPLEGLLVGTIEVDGPISALDTRGDLRYLRRLNGHDTESAMRWTGTVRAARPFTVSGLDADLAGVDLEQLSLLVPALAMDGVVTGRVRADGDPELGMTLSGAVSLERGGVRSSVRGDGRFALGGRRPALDLRFDAEPVSLTLLAERFPAVGRLTGDARGPVTLNGTLDDLHVHADLETPAGGVILTGRFDLADDEPAYAAQGAVTDFRLDRVVSGIAETRVTARFGVDGRGLVPATLAGGIHIDLFEARVDEITVRGGSIRATAGSGMLRVDTLVLDADFGTVAAAGSLGLAAGRTGELRLDADADSIVLLEPFLFSDIAVLDSLAVPVPRLGGRVHARATVRGGLADLDSIRITAEARARDALYDGVSAAAASVSMEWRRGTLSLTGDADSMALGHRRLPHARIMAEWVDPEARIVLHARGPGEQVLDVGGSVTRTAAGGAFHLRRMELRSGEGVWALQDSAQGRFGRNGIAMQPLVLARQRDGASVRLAGELPWRESGLDETREAAFVAELNNVRIGELLRLAQSDTMIDGMLEGAVTIRGTALAPVMEGRLDIDGLRLGDAVFDSARVAAGYRDLSLSAEVRGWRGRRDILHGEASIPLDLALADRTDRRLDRPMRLQLRADSVPASLLSFLTPGFRDLDGRVHAALTVAGTPRDPLWQGDLRVENGAAFFDHSGVRYRGVEAVARVAEDGIMRIDGRFRTENGTGEVRGTLDLTEPRDPAFDLDLEARRMDVSRRRDVTAVADGQARLTGRYSRPVVSGRIHVLRGEMNLAEILRQHQIVQLDPWLFEMFDTASITFRPPPDNPFVRNLAITDATVSVARDFWLRSPELNVEVAGNLGITYEPGQLRRSGDDLRLTGSLQALRGTYELQVVQSVAGRRFEIRSGSIEFAGTPGVNPDLDIQAQYRVRRRQGDPIDVLAVVTGSLQSPRVHFASDSDPPMSESDLASYLLFGRSSLELTQAESDIVSRGLGFMRPALSGTLSAQLQNVASSLGIPVDYLALSVPEYGLGEYGQNMSEVGWAGVFQETQVDIGFYAWRELFLVGSVRFGSNYSLLNRWGGRAEYRFLGTWTGELYVEDRFARLPSFGVDEIENRTVLGLSVFREWGY